MVKDVTLPTIHLQDTYYWLRTSFEECEKVRKKLYNRLQKLNEFKIISGLLAGSYCPNNHIFAIFGRGIKYFAKKYNRTFEKQCCNVISHEIYHGILLKEHGYEASLKLDKKGNDGKCIAERLKDYGLW